MNEHFVCIKVDREERPDVDAIYMDAVQAMTGHGGWPLNAFLDPRQRARSTPAPTSRREPRQGCPAWRERAGGVAEAWATQRDEIDAGGARGSSSACRRGARMRAPDAGRSTRRRSTPRSRRCARALRRRARRLRRRAEVPRRRPRSSSCSRRGERDDAAAHAARDGRAAASTTRSAAASRATRSTPRWVVPHFEKMLYDNALLARAYLHGWQVTGEPLLRRVCERDARLGAARAAPGPRAASPRRSTPTPRASRASSTSGRSTRCARRSATTRADVAIAHFGMTDGGQLRGREHPRARDARPGRAAGDQGAAAGRARAARAARPRRQAPDLLERADDLGAGRRRRGARARRLPRRRASPARTSCCATLRDADGRLLRTFNAAAPSSPALPGGPRVPARGAADALRGDVRAALVRRGARRSPTSTLARFADAERGGFFSTARRPRAARRAPQGPRGHADPVGQLGGRASGCCGSRG